MKKLNVLWLILPTGILLWNLPGTLPGIFQVMLSGMSQEDIPGMLTWMLSGMLPKMLPGTIQRKLPVMLPGTLPRTVSGMLPKTLTRIPPGKIPWTLIEKVPEIILGIIPGMQSIPCTTENYKYVQRKQGAEYHTLQWNQSDTHKGFMFNSCMKCAIGERKIYYSGAGICQREARKSSHLHSFNVVYSSGYILQSPSNKNLRWALSPLFTK